MQSGASGIILNNKKSGQQQNIDSTSKQKKKFFVEILKIQRSVLSQVSTIRSTLSGFLNEMARQRRINEMYADKDHSNSQSKQAANASGQQGESPTLDIPGQNNEGGNDSSSGFDMNDALDMVDNMRNRNKPSVDKKTMRQRNARQAYRKAQNKALKKGGSKAAAKKAGRAAAKKALMKGTARGFLRAAGPVAALGAMAVGRI